MDKVIKIAQRFALEGTVVSAREYGDGHINDTYLVVCQHGEHTHEYVIQRINRNVFADGRGLMNNMEAVTSYTRAILERDGGDVERGVLTIVPTRDGDICTFDEDGYCWRVTKLVKGVYSVSVVENQNMLRETGRAFGKFVHDLDGFDASVLTETIPNFHHTPKRFENFKRAVTEDRMGRAAGVQKEIEFALGYEEFVHTLVDQLESGVLPLRVTHNDTKINNLLLDEESGKAVCVIDLDTVMPGLTAYDFGDSIRSGTNPADEDERDLSKVTMDIDLYEAFAAGFLSETGAIMNKEELLSLPVGAKMMTFECGIRFLSDYLDGDVYFKVHREGQNLDRARTQFKMVADMEKVWDRMNEIVLNLAK
ncbi:MAG: aminoglycoside phosphotransferase family protein [Clostridia bacterium]|nr:aminoglycoside phosphotransferase family protein [Clostridia bacterium]